MTETTIFCQVEGDDDHEHYAFHVQSETAPAVGDAVLYWIDHAAEFEINRSDDEGEKDRLGRMRRALFFVTARQFEIREVSFHRPKACWQVTLRHATPEEAARWGGEISNVNGSATAMPGLSTDTDRKAD